MYSFSETAKMVGLKRKQLDKIVKALELIGHTFTIKEGVKIFSKDDYRIIDMLKGESESEPGTLIESAKRVLSGNLVSLPVVNETIPQDKGSHVTNLELLKTMQKGFIDAQNNTGNVSIELSEQIQYLLAEILSVKDYAKAIDSRVYHVEQEIVANNRLNRDIMIEIRALQNVHKQEKRKKKFNLWNWKGIKIWSSW